MLPVIGKGENRSVRGPSLSSFSDPTVLAPPATATAAADDSKNSLRDTFILHPRFSDHRFRHESKGTESFGLGHTHPSKLTRTACDTRLPMLENSILTGSRGVPPAVKKLVQRLIVLSFLIWYVGFLVVPLLAFQFCRILSE
jgi:hypothetical protein